MARTQVDLTPTTGRTRPVISDRTRRVTRASPRVDRGLPRQKVNYHLRLLEEQAWWNW